MSLPSSELPAPGTCPCCGGALGAVFYEMGPVPVHSCLMLQSAQEATNFPQGHVKLAACQSCSFVTNTVFDRQWSAYAPEYEDQQSFSPTFNAFAQDLAASTIARYDLAGKRAVEVGCSKGDFLRLLCDLGEMECVGIDPSALPGRVSPPARGAMRLVQEYYGPQHLQIPADFLSCRHTLEHISNVHETLLLMAAHLRRTPGGVLQIEVPDATRVWEDLAFEDVYYEHCSYFTAGSLAAALRRAGFAITDLRREYGDQYLLAEATLNPADDRVFAIEEAPQTTLASLQSFAQGVADLRAAWREIFAQMQAAGKTVAIWGSGSKCIAFLRGLDVVDQVGAIVDINPHREGCFAPSLPQAIALPARLKSLQPDLVVVMNKIYLEEIRAACADMGLAPRFEALGALDLAETV